MTRSAHRILILVGTDHHPFDRLVAWADHRQTRFPDDVVFIQHGQSRGPATAPGVSLLAPAELADRVRDATVVITHGGPGTIADARSGGHRPIVVPRDPGRGEHVDDHQQRFAAWAAERGLVVRVPGETDLDHVIEDLGERGTRGNLDEGTEAPTNVDGVRAIVEGEYGTPGRAVAADAPLVLFIGGAGRSGSTLLESMLARLNRVTVLGEVTHLWERGLGNDELCACGAPFSSCPFWVGVGQLAYGGWDKVDLERVRVLRDAVDRQRRMPSTARRHPGSRMRAVLLEYGALHRRLFQAASRVSGADVVVDSSKVPPTALAYSHDRHIDLRVMHIMRDSRGVAFSWSKSVPRPETRTAELMPQPSAVESSLWWLSHNYGMKLLTYRHVPVTHFRYEDFVDDPAAVVQSAWRDLNLPGDGLLPMVDQRSIELLPTHSVAGNPNRFRPGLTTVRPDTAWRDNMPARDRRLVTALTLPALAASGYLRRNR